MSNNDGNLTCAVNIEWLNKQGIVVRKLAQKKANLRLIRNEQREILVEVTAEKTAPVKLLLKGISVHKKFMNEGKASIKFQPLNCTLYLSNAPTGQLLTFLRTIFVKMTGGKGAPNANTSLRTQLLSNKPQQFEEISPLTNLEIEKARAKVSKSTDTTPSPLASKKRKLERNDSVRPPAAKKLYSSSPVPNEPLDLEQQEVLDACVAGHNVFFTGSAGTGKSYLLKRIIGALPPDVTTATASTEIDNTDGTLAIISQDIQDVTGSCTEMQADTLVGACVAACHIGGITLHQFAGIGKGEATLERSVELASKPPTVSIWRKCKHLIIDEISMVDGEYFEKIEQVARKVRRNDKPFGGIQLILCGDFFQLPPIRKSNFGESKALPPRFCFKTKAWESCRLTTYELRKVHRQQDEGFISILNKIRIGRVDKEVTDTLAATAKQKIEQGDILATRLCTHTKDADIINETKLKALPGESQLFEALDAVPGTTKQLDQQTPVPSKLELKIGAQVMLLKNINVASGLVNGARGVVKEFRHGLPVVQFRNKKEYVASHERWAIKTAGGGSLARKQIPLKLAWAFSIHKSQGLTLDCVEMSLGRVFEAGQAYVALSRAQSLETLRVLDFNSAQVWANPDVIKFYRTLNEIRIVPLGPIHKKNSVGMAGKKRLPMAKSKLFDKPLVSIC